MSTKLQVIDQIHQLSQELANKKINNKISEIEELNIKQEINYLQNQLQILKRQEIRQSQEINRKLKTIEHKERIVNRDNEYNIKRHNQKSSLLNRLISEVRDIKNEVTEDF